MYVRKSARAFLFNPRDEVFLFKFAFSAVIPGGVDAWITPGGGLEPGEDFPAALRRELKEELALAVDNVGPVVTHRERRFTAPTGEEWLSQEQHFLLRIPHTDFVFDNVDRTEEKHTLAGRWWTADEVAVSREVFFIEDFAGVLRTLTQGPLPPLPFEIL